jgi:hypothetical protein
LEGREFHSLVDARGQSEYEKYEIQPDKERAFLSDASAVKNEQAQNRKKKERGELGCYQTLGFRVEERIEKIDVSLENNQEQKDEKRKAENEEWRRKSRDLNFFS